MAKKIRSTSGSIYCSYCATAVEEEDTACANCGKWLEPEVIEGRVCHSCGNPVGKLADVCPKCGAKLSDDELEDDEYLSKLLGWGDETEHTLKKKIEEKQKALDIFKKVAGTDDETKRANFEAVREPLQRIHEITSKRLEELGEKIVILKGKKREDGANEDMIDEIEALSIEKEHLVSMVAGIEYMNDAFEVMFKKEHKDIKQMEGELNVYVREFKKVVEKKEQLKMREDELKKWETQLRTWEEELVKKEGSLEDIKDRYTEGEKVLEEIEEELPADGKITQEEWLDEQRKIQRELFKLKDMWEGEGEEDIPDLDDISSEKIPALKKLLKKKEEKWKDKISELQEEIDKIKKEKEALTAGMDLADIEIGEIISILSVLDKLLGDLPEKKIKKFAKSKEFKLYEKIMDSLGL